MVTVFYHDSVCVGEMIYKAPVIVDTGGHYKAALAQQAELKKRTEEKNLTSLFGPSATP